LIAKTTQILTTMNVSEYLQNNKKVPKSLSAVVSDRFLFCLILILGGIGTYHSIGLIKHANIYNSHEITLGNRGFSDNDLSKYSFTRPLSIDGQMQVGKPVELSVDKLLETEPLYLDLGNGDIERVIGERRIDVSYALPGKYEIELFTVQENVKMTLSNQEVIIESDYTQISSNK